jgi:cell division protein FtsZ
MVFTLDETFDAKAKMKVIGIGGAGGNAVNRMVTAGLNGVEFISVNTDAMALDNNHAPHRIQIGERITKGLGAGANPEIGRIAMEEDRDRVAALLEGSDMLFITAGMGGGTGTGGAPVVAEIAREMDILTVAIVTRPFLFEGKVRDKNAKKGIDDLRKSVDTIIIIPNQKLLSIVDRSTALLDAFKTADDVLYQATKGISDLISVHGLVNLDFADVRTIMKGMGDALMGTGFAEGDDRAIVAADTAIHSPLLDDISINGARGILINITGGEDMTLYDVSDATQAIYDAVGEEAESNIIFGAVTDPAMNGKLRVTVIATGFNEESVNRKQEKVAFKPGIISAEKPKDKRVEQMSISLTPPAQAVKPTPREETTESAAPREESRLDEQSAPTLSLAPEPQAIEFRPVELEPVGSVRDEEYCDKPQFAPAIDDRGLRVERDTGSFELPPFLKKEKMKQDAQIFVSKGRVITHYEDDMDVPTFLRKQMQ